MGLFARRAVPRATEQAGPAEARPAAGRGELPGRPGPALRRRLSAQVASHPDAAAILVLVVVAAVPRIVLQLGAPIFFFPDATSYLEPAMDLTGGNGLTARLKRPIGYPLFLAAVLLGSRFELLAVAAIQHALGLLTVALTYLLGRTCFNRAVGFVAGLLVALTGPLLIYEQAPLTESPLVLLLVALSLALIAATRARGFRPAAYGGLLLGLATLVRPVAESLLPVALAFACLGPDGWRRRLLASVTLLAGFALVVLPGMLRNQLTYGRFSVGGTPGQSLIARTLNYSHGEFVFDGPGIPPETDPTRQAARRIIQAAEKSSDARDRLGAQLGLDEPSVESLMRDIALDAIKRQPFDYLGEVATSLVGIFYQDERSVAMLWTSQHAWDNHRTLRVLIRPPTRAQEAARGLTELMLRIFRPARYGLALPLLGLLGLALALALAGRRWLLAPALVPGVLTLVLLVVHVAVDGPVARYRHATDPLLDVLAVGGLVLALDRLSRRSPALDPPVSRRAGLVRGLRGCLPLAFVLVICLLPRLVGLAQFDPDTSNSEYDEGVALEQLSLMAAGFRPPREIDAAQGALPLDFAFPAFHAFGETVAAARLPGLAAAVTCWAGVGLAAWQLAGPLGGLAALALLGLSPEFLGVSRLALAEAPSMAPACLAVWLALRFRERRSGLPLHASAACWALGLLLQPLAGLAALPIAVALLEPPAGGRPGGWRAAANALAGWSLTALTVSSLVLLLGGPSLLDPWFRASPPGAGRGSLGTNWQQVRSELTDDGPLLILAGAALVPLLRAGRFAALLAASWLVATLLALLTRSPLIDRQVVYVLPPLALLGGSGVGVALKLCRPPRTARRFAAALPFVLAVGCYSLNLDPTVRADWERARPSTDAMAPEADLPDAISLVRSVAAPDEYIVTDHAYLAFLADRLVPPQLVDLSRARLLSTLPDEYEAARRTEAFDAKAIVYWAGSLQLLRQYSGAIEPYYSLVAMYDHNRAVYVRNDALELLSGPLGGANSDVLATFGGGLQLTGFQWATFGTGHDLRLTLRWRTAPPVDPDAYTVYLELRGPDGKVVLRRDDRFLPPWRSSPWPAGQSMLQRRWLDLDGLDEGTYALTLSVTAGRGGNPLAATVGPSSKLQPGPGPGLVTLTPVVAK